MRSEPEEPWEALDHDDSDLHSFLRPCKTSLTTKTLVPQAPETSSPRLVPGPAGFVQAAMLRKSRLHPSSLDADGEPIPTQDYIRKAFEDPAGEDDDFSCNPWLFAVDFIRSEGLVGDDGVAIGTPLSAIKKIANKVVKINQVVGIIKSCIPNGFGDLMITLKDPTGTMDASVHRRVLAESEFGKEIHVGAVLLLKKVAVFSPSRSTCYLNITIDNVFKVISKDGLLVSKQIPFVTGPVAVEIDKQMRVVEKSSCIEQGASEQMINNEADMTNLVMEEGSPASQNVQEDNISVDRNANTLNQTIDVLPGKETSCGFDQQRAPTSSLPEWTDEQLDELFAFD